jgi:hypothetical protein
MRMRKARIRRMRAGKIRRIMVGKIRRMRAGRLTYLMTPTLERIWVLAIENKTLLHSQVRRHWWSRVRENKTRSRATDIGPCIPSLTQLLHPQVTRRMRSRALGVTS